MSDVMALMAGLVERPGLLRALIEKFGRAADLGETELGTLAPVGDVFWGIVNRIGGPSLGASAGSRARVSPAPADTGASGSFPACGQGVAVAGAVSLLAVAGVLAVAGTAALVALSGDNRQRSLEVSVDYGSQRSQG
jgi:hypothetical protein